MGSFFKALFKAKQFKDKLSDSADGDKKSEILKNPLVVKGMIYGGGGLIILITVVFLIAIVVFMPVLLAEEYFGSGKKYDTYDYCGGSCGENESKFYSKLNSVKESYKSKGVDIDVNLISGTVFYGSTLTRESFDPDDPDSDELIDDSKIHVSDVKALASHMVSGNQLDYGKYRNYLIDTYIPKRFGSMYSDEKGIERIADEIMSYASYKNANIADGSYIYQECAQVCTTDGSCYDLEEYVTRVVTGESGFLNSFTNNYVEQWKAQAVAARTFVLNKTNNCSKPIENSQNAQVADRSANVREDISEVVNQTAGKILTYNGNTITAMYDSFYKNNNYHCDDQLCYATYKKVGGDDNSTHEIKAYKKWSGSFAGGHGYGMSQFGALYLSDIGWNYEDILKYFYSDGVEISTLTTVSRGVISGGKYTSNAPLYNSSSDFFSNINYNYYATVAQAGASSSGYSYYGECPWYAKGRAIELIANSNMPDELKNTLLTSLRNTRGNGGEWYANTSSELFEKTTDIYAAKPGSIVSWSQSGRPGHVGIVENVEYDESGRAKRILLSEGWNGTGNPSGASYSMKWWDVEQFRHYYGRHNFIGYVYLLG